VPLSDLVWSASWAAPVLVFVVATALVIITLFALRGTAPKERAAIIRAIAELVRSLRRHGS
jgi:hypothetical protein